MHKPIGLLILPIGPIGPFRLVIFEVSNETRYPENNESSMLSLYSSFASSHLIISIMKQ